MAAENKLSLPRLVIAAPASGSGKTTFTMGLLAALCRRKLVVQPFKVGPDYIDPAFHTAITKLSSINLDGWLLDESCIKKMFASYASQADISVVEGVMGLYDGYGEDPLFCSTAGIAKMLDAPVILVMQVDAMAATTAAIVYGLKELCRVPIAGVVINKPSSPDHFRMVKNAIEKHAGVRVLGYLPKTEGVELKSRHLGLVQSSETEDLPKIVDSLADLIENNIDLDGILETARGWAPLDYISLKAEEVQAVDKVRIAVAYDKAFSFYYHENFEILRRLGAETVFFSPLKDSSLPSGCKGIYLGGGYPEVFAGELAANQAMRMEILRAAETGMPVYAECGGYMYLNKNFTGADGISHEFVGFFDGETVLTNRLQNFGYTTLTGVQDTVLFGKGDSIKAHEFHKSVTRRTDNDFCVKAEKIKNGKAVEWYCGRKRNRVFGMYPHIYFPSNISFAENFVRQCRKS